MRLGLTPQLYPGLGGPRQHGLAVGLDRGEVDDEGRAGKGVDVGTDGGGGHFALRITLSKFSNMHWVQSCCSCCSFSRTFIH